MKLKKMISVCLLFVLLLAGSLWIDQTMLSSEKPKLEEVAQEMVTDTEKMTESISLIQNIMSMLQKAMWSSVRRIMRRFTVRLLSGWNISRRNFKAV
mgnify:CR=1 FL=1